MIKDQSIQEDVSLIKDDNQEETIDVDLEKSEQAKPSWFVHQIMKYFLPGLKD